MPEAKIFDYYYGDESEQFSFYRIPRQLVTDEAFRQLSTDAKLLYGLLLDRMGLSTKNGWFDELGRVFIYYPLDEIQENLSCGHDKATKLLVELDSGKGVGLIERKKQGQGKPTRIYVKRFTARKVSQVPTPQEIPRLPLFSVPDCGKPAIQTAKKPQSRMRESRSQECGKAAPNYIKLNQTDFSQLNPSIYPSVSPLASLSSPPELIDGCDCRTEIQERIEYDALCRQYSRDDVDEVVEVYLLTTTDDPTGIPTADFTRDGYTYTLLDMTRTDQTTTDTKPHAEIVTIESKSKDMEKILPLLAATKEMTTGDGYTGALTLDTASIKVEAAGYGSSSRTVTATCSYPNLSDADTSLVPKTTEDNGRTLTLSDVQWQEAGGFYHATATYTGTATSKYVTGYVVTANYTGEISKTTSDTVKYTAIFGGTPIQPMVAEAAPFDWSALKWLALPIGAGVVISAVVLIGRAKGKRKERYRV